MSAHQAHQPKNLQKPGSQMLDYAPDPQPSANAHTAINIQQNTAKPPPSHTSTSVRRTQTAPKSSNRPTGDLIMKKASAARENGILCCCCALCTGFISALIGTVLGCLTSSAFCLCRCLNQTTLLGCFCFPFTLFVTWWAGFMNTIASVVKCVFRYIGYDRLMINMCSCTSAGVGSASLLDACSVCYCCCCGSGPEDILCDDCDDCWCGKICEKDVLREPRCKCCIYQEE